MNTNHIINHTSNHNSFYKHLLEEKINTAKNILIIGTQTTFKFNDYFKNAHIDYINVLDRVPDHLINDNTKIYNINNKKFTEILENDIFDKNNKYDIILDDGIHSEKTISSYMKNYTDCIINDGVIIIEDAYDWIDLLKILIPDDLKPHVEIYNILNLKNKIDDTIFVINKMTKL
jgi:hypothetical protein